MRPTPHLQAFVAMLLGLTTGSAESLPTERTSTLASVGGGTWWMVIVVACALAFVFLIVRLSMWSSGHRRRQELRH